MDAGNGDGAVGGDVMPAIRGRRGDVGRSDSVPDEGAGLEQSGAPASQSIGDREIAAAAGKGKTGASLRRHPLAGSDAGAPDPPGAGAGSSRATALGGLPTTKPAARPTPSRPYPHRPP